MNAAVHDPVPEQDGNARHNLQPTRHASGIDERPNVVVDKAALIPGPVPSNSQSILHRRQWACPARKIDYGRPKHDRQVEPSPRGMHENPDRAKDGEQDESEVREQYQVGGESAQHGAQFPTASQPAEARRLGPAGKTVPFTAGRAKVPPRRRSGWARGQAAPAEASALTMKTLKSVAA